MGQNQLCRHDARSDFLTVRGEDGLQTLITAGRLPPTPHFHDLARSCHDVLAAVKQLADQPHNYKTLILDTANGAERLAHEAVCADQFEGDWGETGFNAFGRGERISTNRLWVPLLTVLDRLRDQRRMRIVLCCHTIVRPFNPPDGPPYDRVEQALSKTAWAATSKWCDMILYGTYQVQTDPIRMEKGKVTKARAAGGKVRVIHTERSATFDAGNRHGLVPLVQLGSTPQEAWAAFLAAFPPRPQSLSDPQPIAAA